MIPPRACLLALLLVLSGGCWRSRLTQPKEAVLYYDEEGKAQNPGIVIRAPDYMAMVRRLRAERGDAAVEEYRIKPNLRLRIEIVGVKEMDRIIDVAPNGKISLPLVGEVEAQGMTIGELHRVLQQRYSAYYEEPQVVVNAVSTQLSAADVGGISQGGTVSVFSVVGRLATRTFGQFNSGGTVNLRGDEKVMEVIAKTRSLTGDSEWRQIAIIREAREGMRGVIIVDAYRFLTLGATDENIPVKDGDVIFVPIERNTWVEELVENVRVAGVIGSSVGEWADFVSTVEGIGE